MSEYDYELWGDRRSEPATKSDTEDLRYSIKAARKEIEELRDLVRATHKTLGEIYRRLELALVFSGIAALGIMLSRCS